MSWPLVSLGSIAEKIDYGLTASANFDIDGPKFLRITDLQDGSVEWNSVPSCECSDKDIVQYKLENGDIVFARTGATTGKSYLLKSLNIPAVFASYLIRLRPKNTIDSNFLAHFFQSPHYWNQIGVMANGAAQPGVNASKLKELIVPLPPLPEQKRIAAILDKADAIRRKRQQAIKLADDFLRSMFLDMFGDPVTNPKGWDTKTIEQLITKDRYALKRGPFGGALKKEIFVESGYLVYEQYHALNNDFTFQRYFIDDHKYQELKAFDVKAGDIIISCSGVNLGRLAEVPKDSPKGIINQALMKITLNNKAMTNTLFIDIFSDPSFKKAFYGDFRGAAIPNFPPMSTFKEFRFIVPPKELQEKYSLIKNRLNKMFKSNEYSIDRDLFESLSQKAFSGKL